MSNIKPLSEWKKTDCVLIDEFFLTKEDFPRLYLEATRLSKLTEAEKEQEGIDPKKVFQKPIEQLSPKGLAMMSYLYAEKDDNPKQPLIASTVKDFKHLVQLMDNASPGTEITVILQPTDFQAIQLEHYLSPVHKTVFKIKKTASDLQMVNMDSTGNDNYNYQASIWATTILNENARNLKRASTILYTGTQVTHKKPTKNAKDIATIYSRQSNHYECGVFAIKDARQMNRDADFINKVMNEKNKSKKSNHYQYEIPPEYLKNIQSKAYANAMMESHGKKIVTRKGKTLEQTYLEHEYAYTQHFSKKFHGAVQKFVEENNNNMTKIKEATERYDAGKMTKEELEKRYGVLKSNVAKSKVKETMTHDTTLKTPITLHETPVQKTERLTPVKSKLTPEEKASSQQRLIKLETKVQQTSIEYPISEPQTMVLHQRKPPPPPPPPRATEAERRKKKTPPPPPSRKTT